MENLDSSSVTPQPSANNEIATLRDHVNSLQNWLVSALILMIVVSATFGFFMRRQAKITRAELDSFRQQAEAINAQYQKFTGPGMDDFAKKLVDYGATHPDFVPILTKYGVSRVGPTGAPPVTTKAPTAPAPTPAKK